MASIFKAGTAIGSIAIGGYDIARVGYENYQKYVVRGEDFIWTDAALDTARIVLDSTSIAAGVKLASEPISTCFIAGTLIATAEGQVAIEQIKPGDKVLAENPETGEIAYKTVTQTFVNESDELIHVHVNGEDIVTTPSHPFYVNQFGWTRAAQLRAGDVLVLLNGEYVVVEWIQHEILESPVKVFNLEVEDFHTYFVGECAVLVHNECKIYSNWNDFKERNQGVRGNGGISGFIRKNKPKHAPNVKKWFNKGGTIKIDDGVWTYMMTEGSDVYYGTYTSEGFVTFSDNCLHTKIGNIDIGQFSGNRAKDMRTYLRKLSSYGFTEVPEGFDVHHTADTANGTLQLVIDKWHSLFSHRGGHSLTTNGK